MQRALRIQPAGANCSALPSTARQQCTSTSARLCQHGRRSLTIVAATSETEEARARTESAASTSSTTQEQQDLARELNKFTRQTAATFAPRASTATGKNPAVRGSVLYNIFEAQAWVTLVLGGLLSYNVLFPSDEPDIARLLGMWSIWMFTIPSLRAKECTPREKDALNLLFVGMPILNILLPFVWKSFPFIFMADTLMVVGVYWWKGIWQEVYNIPFLMEGALSTPLPGSGSSSSGEDGPKQ